MKKLWYIFILLQVVGVMQAQDSTSLPKKFTVNGYIKDLQTLNFDKDFKELVTGNLVHNRINIKWKPSEKILFATELRHRLYWGLIINHDSQFRFITAK